MLRYAYYPGCSLESTGLPYDESVRAVFEALDVQLEELEDWNCCGATMYMAAKKIVGYSLSARNLALAQKMEAQVCAPCSSCYTILRKTNRHIRFDPAARERINAALDAAGLSYDREVEVRHPLDILVHDVGLEAVREKVVRPLEGLKVAPYYGCQIVRPHHHFDDLDDPVTMDQLFEVLGADPVYYPAKVRCCGGMLMMTDEEVALKLNRELLEAAVANGADAVATACPLCQMNLEAYQQQINRKYGTDYRLPIVYFTQLLGMALGLDGDRLGLGRLLIPLNGAKAQDRAKQAPAGEVSR